jgi:hypothetical protein
MGRRKKCHKIGQFTTPHVPYVILMPRSNISVQIIKLTTLNVLCLKTKTTLRPIKTNHARLIRREFSKLRAYMWQAEQNGRIEEMGQGPQALNRPIGQNGRADLTRLRDECTPAQRVLSANNLRLTMETWGRVRRMSPLEQLGRIEPPSRQDAKEERDSGRWDFGRPFWNAFHP